MSTKQCLVTYNVDDHDNDNILIAAAANLNQINSYYVVVVVSAVAVVVVVELVTTQPHVISFCLSLLLLLKPHHNLIISASCYYPQKQFNVQRWRMNSPWQKFKLSEYFLLLVLGLIFYPCLFSVFTRHVIFSLAPWTTAKRISEIGSYIYNRFWLKMAIRQFAYSFPNFNTGSKSAEFGLDFRSQSPLNRPSFETEQHLWHLKQRFK